MYPVEIVRLSAATKQKNKELTLMLVQRADGSGIVIKRLGTWGYWGNLHIEQFTNEEDGINLYDASFVKLCEEGPFVDLLRNKKVTAKNQDDLKRLMGMYWYKIGKENALFLVPNLKPSELKDIKENDNSIWQKNAVTGKKERVERSAKLIEEPKPTVEEEIKKNQDWGAF